MKLIMYALVFVQLATSVLIGLQFEAIANGKAAAKQQTCAKIAGLDNTFVGLIRQGERQLPTLAYYKQHPKELVKVIASDERAIRALTPPKYC